MGQHVNITLVQGATSLDLRLPVRIEVSRLIKELDRILGRSDKRLRYQLFVKNKGLLLSEGTHLSDTPLSTGDIIMILED